VATPARRVKIANGESRLVQSAFGWLRLLTQSAWRFRSMILADQVDSQLRPV